jgi:hypothetical protein
MWVASMASAYSDTTKDSAVFMDVDCTPDLSFPELKNLDYFLGLLYGRMAASIHWFCGRDSPRLIGELQAFEVTDV